MNNKKKKGLRIRSVFATFRRRPFRIITVQPDPDPNRTGSGNKCVHGKNRAEAQPKNIY